MKTILMIAMAVSALAGHKELNGTWTGEHGTITIDEREGNITVTRNFVYDGEHGTVSYRDQIDSRNGASIHDGKDSKTKAHWDHDMLKVTSTRNGEVTTETYALTPDGKMTATVVKGQERPVTLTFHR
jgi:hypothetical protein